MVLPLLKFNITQCWWHSFSKVKIKLLHSSGTTRTNFRDFFIFPVFLTTNTSLSQCITMMVSASHVLNSCCYTPMLCLKQYSYMSNVASPMVGWLQTCIFSQLWNDNYMKIYNTYFISIYLSIYIHVIYIYVSRHKWSKTHRALKSHSSKMSIIYMQSWKQCALPVIITMALWQLMHLGT